VLKNSKKRRKKKRKIQKKKRREEVERGCVEVCLLKILVPHIQIFGDLNSSNFIFLNG
jgi:hypothetical protein